MEFNYNKGFRLLDIYERLNKGELIKKKELSIEYSTSEKTIQRDIEDLRVYLSEKHLYEGKTAILYDAEKHGYYLSRETREWLTNEEIMGISKIILESRAFNKLEMEKLLNSLILQAEPMDRKIIKELLLNERFHYIPLHYNAPILNRVWEISNYINNKEVIEIEYERQDKKQVKKEVKPVSIVFSEYYFYLIAYLNEPVKDFPAIFRIDRIKAIKPENEKFDIPYKERFEDGEFRKRIQFMYPGELTYIRFKFWGASLEAILDRFPTARIIGKDGDKFIIEADVYGSKGAIMWLLSQMEYLQVIKPDSLREKMKQTINKMMENYK